MKITNSFTLTVIFFLLLGTNLKASNENIEENVVSSTQVYMDDDSLYSENPYSRFRLSVDGGYGWRTARIPDGLSSSNKDFYENMNSGPAFQGTFTYFFKETLGIGLNYSLLWGNSENDFLLGGSGSNSYKKGESLLSYIGGDFVGNIKISEDSRMDVRAGLGYSSYNIKETSENSYIEKEWGSTVGLHLGIGLETMLSQQLALGINLSSFSGLVSTIHIERYGKKETHFIDDLEDRVGLGQIRITLGLRYYFHNK